jgi:cobalt-zinc-cadmium efflux system outer membrane protein
MRSCWLLAVLSFAASAQTTLSLREAVSRALAIHPLLAAGSSRIEASQGLQRQAGLRPNPRLVFQVENLRSGGIPSFDYSRDADTFLYLTQPLETAGKRGRRVEAAAAGLRRSELERELLAHRIAGQVKRAYWAAAGAQRLHELLLETERNFRQVVEYHELRVREGAMAEADLLRVRLEGERLAINANSAALEAERARIQLLREMGQAEFPDTRLTEPFEETGAPPPEPAIAQALENRPEMKLARQALEQTRAAVRLAEVEWKPDVELLAGYKRTAGFTTALAGIQFGLPFLNRNQGRIAAITAEFRAAESDLAATGAVVAAEVRSAFTESDMRRRQLAESLQALREHAAESSRIAQAAYREGGTDLLRLLDSERNRLEIEMLYFRTLGEYRQSLAALETALGVAP